MSHLSDEDDEYLYGDADSDKGANPLLDTKTGRLLILRDTRKAFLC